MVLYKSEKGLQNFIGEYPSLFKNSFKLCLRKGLEMVNTAKSLFCIFLHINTSEKKLYAYLRIRPLRSSQCS